MLKNLLTLSSAALISSAALAQAPAQPAGEKPAESKAPEAAPKKAASGKSLEVPEAQKKLGTVYYTTSAMGKQVTFTSKAHNASFDGNSAGVIGYAVAGPADNPADLKAGAWVLPVKSLETGNKIKNKNMAKPEWLDAEKHPDIVFVLKKVTDISPMKSGGTGKSFKGTLVGDMTIRGVTREISVAEATIGFVQGTEKTAKVAKGDLMAVRCKYKVKLSDFGITNDYITKEKSVADEIEIDQSLSLATVPPEEQPAPAVPAEAPKGEGPKAEPPAAPKAEPKK
jgi:polyisoprenoid-binding protein YceI